MPFIPHGFKMFSDGGERNVCRFELFCVGTAACQSDDVNLELVFGQMNGEECHLFFRSALVESGNDESDFFSAYGSRFKQRR